MIRSILFQFFAFVFVLSNVPIRADESVIPHAGWEASRYETLWTKSPFAVATSETGPEPSTYSLWGIAQIDGLSYASLTDKQSNEHFLLASDKPSRGLSLVSITRGTDASGIQVVVQKDGLLITLKLEHLPSPAGPNEAHGGNPVPPPGPNLQNISDSGPNNNFNRIPEQVPPQVMMRPHLIRIPPVPQH